MGQSKRSTAHFLLENPCCIFRGGSTPANTLGRPCIERNVSPADSWRESMLLRMGAVVWWLGALVGLLFTGVAAMNEAHRWSCTSTLETMADVDRSEALAAANAADQALKAGVPVDKYAAGLGLAGSAPPDRRDTDALHTDARQCKALWPPMIFLAVAVGLAAVSWSLAFILGGSFWRPPSQRKAATWVPAK